MKKKLSKYSCPTLTNLNYKLNDEDRLMVFYNKDDAKHHIKFCEDDLIKKSFDVHSVDMSDIHKLAECFDLMYDFY
tara:strand:- start:1 stop:228 length:228 start_codon:yes stop_codon:yes gene_type:complete